MILDFDELLAAMPAEEREAIQADVQKTLRDQADRQERKEVEYAAPQVAKDKLAALLAVAPKQNAAPIIGAAFFIVACCCARSQ